MTPNIVVHDYIVRSIQAGHMGRPYYFDSEGGSGSYICETSLFTDTVKMGDRITVEYHYHLYGGPWKVRVNGVLVFQMSVEKVEAERKAQQEFVEQRMRDLLNSMSRDGVASDPKLPGLGRGYTETNEQQ